MSATTLLRLLTAVVLSLVLACREVPGPRADIQLALVTPRDPGPFAQVERLELSAYSAKGVDVQVGALTANTLTFAEPIPETSEYLVARGLDALGATSAAGVSMHLAGLGNGSRVALLFARLNVVSELRSEFAEPRHAACVTRLDDGTLAIVGGRDTAGTAVRSTEVFDPAEANLSIAVPRLDAGSNVVDCAALPGRRVLVTTSDDTGLVLIDFDAGQSGPVRGCDLNQRGAALAATGDDVAVVGGLDTNGDPTAAVQILRRAASPECVADASLTSARSGASVVALSSGDLVVGGGVGLGGPVDTVERIDASTWQAVEAQVGLLDAENITLLYQPSGSVLQLGNDSAGMPLAGTWTVTRSGLAYRPFANAPSSWGAQSRAVATPSGEVWVLVEDGSVERLHVDRFSAADALAESVAGASLVGDDAGNVLIIGGRLNAGSLVDHPFAIRTTPAVTLSEPEVEADFVAPLSWGRGLVFLDASRWGQIDCSICSGRVGLGIDREASTERAGLDALVVVGQAIRPPFTVEVDLGRSSAAADSQVAVVPHFCDATRYVYVALTDSGELAVTRLDGTVETVLATHSDAALRLTNMPNLVVDHDGDRLTVWAAGQSLEVSLPETDCATPRVGLGADGAAVGTTFDDLQVSRR